MQHTRKMVLVPEEAVERFQKNSVTPSDQIQKLIDLLKSKDLPTAQTPGDPISRLDHQLYDTLNSKKIKDDREKWDKYKEILTRYLFFNSDTESKSVPVSSVNNNTINATSDNTTLDLNETKYPPDSILKNIPKPSRGRAQGLLEYIKTVDGGHRLRWNEKGQVILDGKNIENSNIVDLIYDAVLYRRKNKSIGRVPFARFLRDINAPHGLVTNNSFWTVPEASPPRRSNVTFAEVDQSEFPTPTKATFPGASSTPISKIQKEKEKTVVLEEKTPKVKSKKRKRVIAVSTQKKNKVRRLYSTVGSTKKWSRLKM